MGIVRCAKEHAFEDTVYNMCPICNKVNIFVKTNPSALRTNLEYLNEGYILNNIYIIEKVFKEDFMCITYLAFDTAKNIRILIDELYPLTIAFRNCKDSYDVVRAGDDGVKLFNKALALMTDVKGAGKYKYISTHRDLVRANETVYLIYQYLEWKPLTEFIQARREELAADEIIQMIKPVAKELQMLHQKKQYHGNISVQNAMVSGNNEILLTRASYERIKLIKETLWQVKPFQDNSTIEMVNAYISGRPSLCESQYNKYRTGEVSYLNIDDKFDVIALAIIIRELLEAGVNKTSEILFKKDSERKIKALEFIDNYFCRDDSQITMPDFFTQIHDILQTSSTPKNDKPRFEATKINIDQDIKEILAKMKRRSRVVKILVTIIFIVIAAAVYLKASNS